MFKKLLKRLRYYQIFSRQKSTLDFNYVIVATFGAKIQINLFL